MQVQHLAALASKMLDEALVSHSAKETAVSRDIWLWHEVSLVRVLERR